jgi:hypothetical protein
MQKISTMRTSGKNIFQGQLTIGVDLGDRSSAYCVLSEAGAIVLESAHAARSRTPNWHRAKIAPLRVRMEGWRQRRLG